MARFILKWRYIKSGSAKHGTNLVKYIATREGVEKCDESWKHQSATTEQQHLIKQLTKDFPDAVNSFEYQDYINQLVEEAGVKREQNTGFFEIEGQKEDEGGGNKADGSPATSV